MRFDAEGRNMAGYWDVVMPGHRERGLKESTDA